MEKTIEKIIERWEQNFCDRLREILEQRGLTAQQVSLDMGKNPGYISEVMKGKTIPTMNSLYQLCVVLQVEPEVFFKDPDTAVCDNKYGKKVCELLERLGSENQDFCISLLEFVEKYLDNH